MSIKAPTADERALAEDWRHGRAFSRGPDTQIDAAVIRALLLACPPEGPGHGLDWTPAPGPLRIEGVTITGSLNLQGIRRRADGTPIPQLEAIDCVFEGAINLNFAALDGLSLIACDIPGLHARDARIDGRLDLRGAWLGNPGASEPALLLDGAAIRGDLILAPYVDPNGQPPARRFRVVGGVSFRVATIEGQIEAAGAEIINGAGFALDGDGARVRGAIFLTPWSEYRFTAQGGVLLAGAEAAELFVSGASLNGCEEHKDQDGKTRTGLALNAQGMRIGGQAHLGMDDQRRFRFQARGGVSFVAARMDELQAGGAEIIDPEGLALNCDRAIIAGGVFLRLEAVAGQQFAATGRVSFQGARIGGLELNGAWLDVAQRNAGPSRETGGLCLKGLTVTGTMKFRGIRGPDNAEPNVAYHFEGANAARLSIDPNTALPAKGHLHLDGFTFESIEFIGKAGPDVCYRWLDWQFSPRRKQERSRDWKKRVKFTPHAFEHLAGVLRRAGHDLDANRVAVSKREWALKLAEEPRTSKLLAVFMRYVSGFGYEPLWALFWTTVWWMVGIIWITASLRWEIVEINPVHFKPDGMEKFEYVAAAWDEKGIVFDHPLTSFRKAPNTGLSVLKASCPGVVIPVYALELMTPIGELGQADDCRIETNGQWEGAGFWGGALQVWRAVYQIVGAILIAILGVTTTGLIRRD